MLVEISAKLVEMQKALKTLKDVTAKAAEKEVEKERAFAYREEVFPAMGALRKPVDELEMLVDKDYWPVPSYGDLMFEV
jgi:glutamine synthetase